MDLEIRIKGLDKKLVVTGDKGLKIKADWESYRLKQKIDTPVEINGWTGMLSDIRDFASASSSRAAEGSVEFQKTLQDYNQETQKLRALSAEEKGKRLGYFRLLYSTFTGEKPSKEIETKAEKIQTEFFKARPYRTICDPVLFRSLVKNYRQSKTSRSDGMISMGDLVAMSGLRLIENVAAQDMTEERMFRPKVDVSQVKEKLTSWK